MNKLILLVGVLICLVAVNARHYIDRSADEGSDDLDTKPREHGPGRRKRRWQSSYGYDYQPSSYYYPDRRDDRNNQETIQNIYRLLEDISSYLRRMPPPPPPQPIYVPYPVAFPTQVTCKAPANSSNPDPLRRNTFTDSMDQNRNWGIVAPQEFDYGNENDGARPISFSPLIPKQLMKRPAPEVDHGSQQSSHSTDAPSFIASPPQANSGFSAEISASKAASVVPGMCNAAILSCCSVSDEVQKKQCFENVGCLDNYSKSTCTNDSIQRAINSFRTAYSPVQ